MIFGRPQPSPCRRQLTLTCSAPALDFSVSLRAPLPCLWRHGRATSLTKFLASLAKGHLGRLPRHMQRYGFGIPRTAGEKRQGLVRNCLHGGQSFRRFRAGELSCLQLSKLGSRFKVRTLSGTSLTCHRTRNSSRPPWGNLVAKPLRQVGAPIGTTWKPSTPLLVSDPPSGGTPRSVGCYLWLDGPGAAYSSCGHASSGSFGHPHGIFIVGMDSRGRRIRPLLGRPAQNRRGPTSNPQLPRPPAGYFARE